jgi:hypothetical protein
MKSLLKTGLFLTFALLLTADLSFAQERGKGDRPSPNASVSQDIGSTTVSITYGRPGLKGRSLSTLAPEGKVWRTGANESTAITFSDDVMVGDAEIAAGTYSLYTIPGESWTFIINNKLSWGTQYDESEDVARIPAATTMSNAPQMERFTIYFDNLSSTGAHLILRWGTAMAAVPIKLAE